MSVYKRGNVWWVRFQFNGEEVRESSRSGSKRVAEEFERELRAEYARLYRGGRVRYTFDDLMTRFIREHLPTIKTQSKRRYGVSITALRPHFEGVYLDEITPSKLVDFGNERRREVTTSTVRRDLACLSSAFAQAIDWEWADHNPVKALNKKRFRDAPPRRRYLSHDEYADLLDHAGDYLRPMITFAVETGLRLEEQLSLTWENVRMAEKEIIILDTKTGTPRTIPITGPAMLVLKRTPRHLHSPYVFCKKDGTRYRKLTRGLAGAARRAVIKDLRWHDLRRTFGSWSLQAGVSMEVVSKWLGHASIAVTERAYAFLVTKNLHDAAQKLAQSTRIAKRAKKASD